MNGLLVLDKMTGMTSRDALNRAAGWLPRGAKFGHAGTLDPLATGVLVGCVGQATRLVEFVQAMPKVYRATIALGATSDTDDADGELTPSPTAREVTRAEVEAALAEFVGEIAQVPPRYSAARVAGSRAHALARKGREVDLAPRVVRVDQIDVLSFGNSEIEVEIRCGKGTYIRSIARDLGERLGCGGYIKALRRTAIGPFVDSTAIDLDATRADALAKMRPMADAVALLGRVDLDHRGWRRVRDGVGTEAEGDGEVAVYVEGAFVGVAVVVDGVVKPGKVLA